MLFAVRYLFSRARLRHSPKDGNHHGIGNKISYETVSNALSQLLVVEFSTSWYKISGYRILNLGIAYPNGGLDSIILEDLSFLAITVALSVL